MKRIYTSESTLTDVTAGTVIVGDGNKITGGKSFHVKGDRNTIRDAVDVHVAGNHNTIHGDRCTVMGTYNLLRGHQCTVRGGKFNTHEPTETPIVAPPAPPPPPRAPAPTPTPTPGLGAAVAGAALAIMLHAMRDAPTGARPNRTPRRTGRRRPARRPTPPSSSDDSSVFEVDFLGSADDRDLEAGLAASLATAEAERKRKTSGDRRHRGLLPLKPEPLIPDSVRDSLPPDSICVGCMERLVTTTFNPCGHSVSCLTCLHAPAANLATCWKCRAPTDERAPAIACYVWTSQIDRTKWPPPLAAENKVAGGDGE